MARRRRRIIGGERRGGPRVRISAPMRVTVGDTTVEGVGFDVSATGLCLDAPVKASVGVPVAVAFSLDGLDLRVVGHVRWIRDEYMPRLGIEFERLAEHEGMHLSEWVAHNYVRSGDTLDNLPVVAPGGPTEPAPNPRAAVAVSEQARAATAGPPANKRRTRPGGRTRHYSLHLDDSDG